MVGAAPLGSSVLGALPLPGVLQQGCWLHHDENASLRYTAAGATADDIFVSAAEDDLPSSPSMLLTEILPSQQTGRRAVGRGRRPSVLGLGVGSSAKALSAMLTLPKSSTPHEAPAVSAKSKHATKSNEREVLGQLTAAVTALGDRLASLEANQRAPPLASPPPRRSSPHAAPQSAPC
eukprot:3646174-Amphidinium_carterae.2